MASVGSVVSAVSAAGVVVGIDGGNSKTDAVGLTLDGEVVGRASAGASSPHQVGLEASVALIGELTARVAGGREVVRVEAFLAGLDFDTELDAYRAALSRHPWPAFADNDVFALLRAGAREADAVAVVCGAGLNAVGVRADGATARFPAIGLLSGDWGGGFGLGEQALWHAARSEDLRGPRTALQQRIPAHFDLSSVRAVTEAVHLGRIPPGRLGELVPLLFELDDPVSAALLDRQAEEIARMAYSCLARLGLLEARVPVVLGGGVLRASDGALVAPVDRRLGTLAPHAFTRLVTAPPLLGAALAALEGAGAPPAALSRAQAALDR